MVLLKEHFNINFSVNVWYSLIEPFVLEQHLTVDNYLNFKLALLMEDVLLETRHGSFFEHDGAPALLVIKIPFESGF
jgi:hypothetical protein